MKSKLLSESGARTFLLVFEKGDDLLDQLLKFVKERDVLAGRFSAIGAFSRATLGFFERERRDYKRIQVDEQVEVMSLNGNVAVTAEGQKLHAHVVLGKSDGTAHGGHLLAAEVWPTLEMFLVESLQPIERKPDEETNLPLISL